MTTWRHSREGFHESRQKKRERLGKHSRGSEALQMHGCAMLRHAAPPWALGEVLGRVSSVCPRVDLLLDLSF
eukprot:Skav217370  [mRNA]  locus=scaffold1119:58257:58956:- [translate_table: standard]